MTKNTVNASRKEVRKFGVMFAVICIAVAGYQIYRQSHLWPWFAGGAAFFLGTGLFGYPLLRPVYIGWMNFAFVLGWINTRVLLGVFFYLIITPIGLAMRLFRRDILDQKIDPSAKSYWRKRHRVAVDLSRYERLF